MRRVAQLSRQARQRKQRLADTHKKRRHYHTLMVAHGYTPHIMAEVTQGRDKGRIYRYYTRTWGPIPLEKVGVHA
ncbi:MAG TPA: hypothetical protein VJ761_05325 [Ktedonobacteraceae bacterium]|nr:hypothetical protein [Ktedonobacteraceae bacterium]